jgi:hypothetical protein
MIKASSYFLDLPQELQTELQHTAASDAFFDFSCDAGFELLADLSTTYLKDFPQHTARRSRVIASFERFFKKFDPVIAERLRAGLRDGKPIWESISAVISEADNSGNHGEIARIISMIHSTDRGGRFLVSLLDKVNLASQEAVKTKLFEMDRQAQTDFSLWSTAQSSHKVECAAGGSLIRMADGSNKKIEDIKLGDKVLSYNKQTKSMEPDEVIQIQIPAMADTETIQLSNGAQLTISLSHPFFLNGEYTPIRHIHIGSDFSYINGQNLQSVHFTNRTGNKEKQVVYNFGTKKNHNYFLSGILVHNALKW